ncbi:P-loop NTPase [Brevibacterium album]|uniref:P-loop NTPase n=1 Tax=Brevibacterium album TaxID=417948 RepID=UPI00040C6E53|nr:P-loop NTPase [Brevibacterium album]
MAETPATAGSAEARSASAADAKAAGAAPPPAAEERLVEALRTVIDPELRRNIVELGMVESARLDSEGIAHAKVLLTIAGCPMKDTISRDVRAALLGLEGVSEVSLELGAMTPEQRGALRDRLRAGAGRVNPFAQPDSLTRVIAVTSGKGGVGKSSMTANLAAALAAQGLRVGVLDADIYGFSIPAMLGVRAKPTKLEDMILPVPGHGVSVMSIGMFVDPGQAVVWRGPMLHRALEQFLTDVFWGELDILLLDLPPGTGDVAISTAQLLPGSELLIVTTPQQAAAQVAERAGALATSTGQSVAGVVENMSWLEMPDGSRNPVFGAGGGRSVADSLAERLTAAEREAASGEAASSGDASAAGGGSAEEARSRGPVHVPLLGQIPLDPLVREGADAGVPAVLTHPDAPGPAAIIEVANRLRVRSRSLAGRSLGLSPR